MSKISRYLLVFITLIVTAIVLPNFYWTLFENVQRSPVVEYSSVDNDFMILRYSDEIERTNSNGKLFSRDEYEAALPLIYFRQLMTNGTMPDSIKGVALDMHTIGSTRARYRYKPKNRFSPIPKLYPLFESESGRVNLEMPDDYFRIHRNGVEFIDAESNEVDLDKSKYFTEFFLEKGFSFPAKIVAGIPTTRKSRDDGYFLTDKTGKLFHFKMIKSEPFVEYVEIPKGIEIAFIECVDLKSREYFAVLYTTSNKVYLISQDYYELLPLPISNFDPQNDEIRMTNNLFHKTISLVKDNEINVWVIDDVYDLVDTYSENWKNKYQGTAGKIFSFLFPAELNTSISGSSFKGFYLNATPGYLFIFGNLLSLLVFVLLLWRKKQLSKHKIIDAIIVGLTGVFGLIATLIFPNKQYK